MIIVTNVSYAKVFCVIDIHKKLSIIITIIKNPKDLCVVDVVL